MCEVNVSVNIVESDFGTRHDGPALITDAAIDAASLGLAKTNY